MGHDPHPGFRGPLRHARRSTRRLPFPASRARRLSGGRTAPCQHALADAFARLDVAGLLRVDDPRRAAHHFAL
ncbi:TetR/AcrR family transcriptional regulator C-terminal domain-containing protein [Rhodococcus opacus]|uniref:TetR/AcrR family transcriptional regulator C-terminal domain-containing protein n=1 Tax=Rhodococcus opacus TaxID=37919 RepID=UPI0018C8AD89